MVWIVSMFTFVDIDLDTAEKNEDQRKELIDYYNSVSGCIANAIEKFIGIVIETVVGVGMLLSSQCMTTGSGTVAMPFCCRLQRSAT
ncbi:hypothetical protein GN244_ATG07280 [Phytophthora infestans]|uniref:Uncharacterized protein n=1 Tax=Phytophthora infestans TaxID=4787 RepID=A0A833TB50_PHYIN|nr:hypothetical protein GN244_ATG07280 [Phytophthora infestans]KAF4148926.1 hypothetical protein GN958_ATG01842 [Phytophthora infestans]